MVLLNGLPAHGDSRAVDRVPHPAGDGGGQGGQPLPQGGDMALLKAARQGDHDRAGTVVLRLPLAQGFSRHLIQSGGSAQDGAAQGAALIDRHSQPVGAQVLRGVLVHPNLLQDHAPLQLHILLGEAGVEQHIAQQVGGPVQMAVQTPGVVAGALLGGVSVDLAADGVDLPGQVGGRAPVSTLEGEVLNKMGRAVFCGAFVAGARPHEKSEGGGAGPRNVFSQKPGSIGKGDGTVHGCFLTLTSFVDKVYHISRESVYPSFTFLYAFPAAAEKIGARGYNVPHACPQ